MTKPGVVLWIVLFAVAPAFGQPPAGAPQKDANDVLNRSLGAVNEHYRGQHQYFNDDLIGNLFAKYPLMVWGIVAVLIGVSFFYASRKEVIVGCFALAAVAAIVAGGLCYAARVAELATLDTAIGELQKATRGTPEYVLHRESCAASAAKVQQYTVIVYVSAIVLSYALLFFTIVAARVVSQPSPKPADA